MQRERVLGQDRPAQQRAEVQPVAGLSGEFWQQEEGRKRHHADDDQDKDRGNEAPDDESDHERQFVARRALPVMIPASAWLGIEINRKQRRASAK